MDDDDLREQVWKLCFRLANDEGGDFNSTDCTNEIMKLVDAELEGQQRSTTIDLTTRG